MSSEEEEVHLGLPAKARTLLKAFQPAYWQALAVVCILYFARFDLAFGTLRAKMVSAAVPALPGRRVPPCRPAGLAHVQPCM